MKHMHKLLAMFLAVVMVMSLATVAFAATSGDTKGHITVENPQKDTTYNAYKIFDVTYDLATAEGDTDKYAYTIDFNSPWYAVVKASEAYTTGAIALKLVGGTEAVDGEGNQTAGLYNVTVDAEKFDEHAVAAFARYLKANIPENADVIAVSNNTEVALGYWMVCTEAGALVNLTTTNPDVTIHDKNEVPPVDKNITKLVCEQEHEHTDECYQKTKVNGVSVGDTVTFEITSTVPTMGTFEKFYFVAHDEMDASFDFTGITSVTIGTGDAKVELTECTHDADADGAKDHGDAHCYTLDQSGKTSLTIAFCDFIQYKDMAGADVVITYTAVLNKNAKFNDVTDNGGNVNKVYLTYSNDPTWTPDPVPGNPDVPNPNPETEEYHPIGQTPVVQTKTYTTDAIVRKMDGDHNVLTGAEFTLTGTALNRVATMTMTWSEDENGQFWKLVNGTFTNEAPIIDRYEKEDGTIVESNASDYASTTQKYSPAGTQTWNDETVAVKASAVVGDDGYIEFKGLGEGTYTLSETVVPDGYNKADDIILEVTLDKETGKWTHTWKTLDGTVLGDKVTTVVVNLPGNLLPSTGGMGTTIFYIVGGLMVVFAGVLLVTKKRMSVEG